MVTIKKDFIPVSNDNRPGYAMTPAYITVHNTANTAKGADAKMHANFVKTRAHPKAGILQLTIQSFISISR